MAASNGKNGEEKTVYFSFVIRDIHAVFRNIPPKRIVTNHLIKNSVAGCYNPAVVIKKRQREPQYLGGGVLGSSLVTFTVPSESNLLASESSILNISLLRSISFSVPGVCTSAPFHPPSSSAGVVESSS